MVEKESEVEQCGSRRASFSKVLKVGEWLIPAKFYGVFEGEKSEFKLASPAGNAVKQFYKDAATGEELSAYPSYRIVEGEQGKVVFSPEQLKGFGNAAGVSFVGFFDADELRVFETEKKYSLGIDLKELKELREKQGVMLTEASINEDLGLLRDLLKFSRRSAVLKFVEREKEKLGELVVFGNELFFVELVFPERLRKTNALALPSLSLDELKQFEELVTAKPRSELDGVKNEQKAGLKRLIAFARSGGVVAEQPKVEAVAVGVRARFKKKEAA